MIEGKTTLIRLPNFHLYDELQQPPLGILYLAAYLEQYDHPVDICDLAGITPDRWLSMLPQDSEIYGITATSPDYPFALQLLGMIRQDLPGRKVIIGGAHASVLPEQCVQDGFDAAVFGEGEDTLRDYVRSRGDRAKSIAGLCYRTDAGPIRNRPRTLKMHIDEFPFPARHLLPESHVVAHDLVTDNVSATVITTSRGCPYKCSFCSQEIWSGHWRLRSAENIAAELRTIREQYGVREVRFVDDMVGAKRLHREIICDAMSRLNLTWRCHLRVDLAGEDMLEAFHKAGCIEVSFGVESGDGDVLRHNRKGWSSPQMALDVVAAAKQVGLRVRAYFIVGLPGETQMSVENTKRIIGALRADNVNIFSFIPYPGCDVWANPGRYDYALTDPDLKHFWMLGDGHSFVGRTSGMSIDDLEKAYRECRELAANCGKMTWEAKQRMDGVSIQ